MYFCSGIAGASYIPAVQAALPRLLGAAAPPGVGSRENRRQCLKVIAQTLEPVGHLKAVLHDVDCISFIGFAIMA